MEAFLQMKNNRNLMSKFFVNEDNSMMFNQAVLIFQISRT